MSASPTRPLIVKSLLLERRGHRPRRPCLLGLCVIVLVLPLASAALRLRPAAAEGAEGRLVVVSREVAPVDLAPLPDVARPGGDGAAADVSGLATGMGARIILEEGFESLRFPPPGWTVYDERNGGGAHVWSRQTCELEPAVGGAAAAWSSGGGTRAGSRACRQTLGEATSTRLAFGNIDTRPFPGGVDVQLRFWADLPLGSQALNVCWRLGDTLMVDCWTLPLTDASQLRRWIGTTQPLHLPQVAGQEHVEVMVWVDDSSGDGAYAGVFVDNIVIRGLGVKAQPRTRDGAALVHVPAGHFWRGSTSADPAAALDEMPQRQVRLRGFWIDRTELSQAAFARFIAATGYETVAEQAGYSWGFDESGEWKPIYGANWRQPFGRGSPTPMPDQPVVGVGWRDAVAYCRWAGRRLPTEAEWEKAARGDNRRRYPWGDDPPRGDLVNLADVNTKLRWREAGIDDGYPDAAPVGAFAAGASPYGALQMAGNVVEWVVDSYDPHFYEAPTSLIDPANRVHDALKVLRGGNYNDDGDHVRSARRISDDTQHSAIDIGFRCAMDEQAAISWLPAVLLNEVHRTPRPSITPTPTSTPTWSPTPTPSPTVTGDPCDPIPGVAYGQLKMDPPPSDRPAAAHADLNVGLRGLVPASGALTFVDYHGPIDAKTPPQLVDLLKRVPPFTSVSRVRRWDWNAGRPGSPETAWPVSALGLRSLRMEHVHVPDSERSQENGYMAMVLYASRDQIALKYTRDDTMATGYGIHLLDVCTEPSLQALYDKLNADGRGFLPAVAAHMPIGRARGDELRVLIRDSGEFMDPRSEPDWWRRKRSP